MKQGKVVLVGAGPGDAGLLTRKGEAVLKRADVVVYDRLVGDGVLSMIPASARTIDVGKNAGHHKKTQEEINRILLEEAENGHFVVRLKGGDPFLFGRGGEELELLKSHEIPFEIVPGVTSSLAVPAYNGIPVTHREYCSSLHIITGHRKQDTGKEIDYEALVRLGGTLVFLMGLSTLEQITEGLLHAGMPSDMPAAVLQQGTTAGQKKVVTTLSSLAEETRKAAIGTPAIVVVGKVCALSDSFAWFEQMPLFGCKILVTRPRKRNQELSEKLHRLGAEVVAVPTIETVEIEENLPLQDAFRNLSFYDWIVFTSPAGVEVFFHQLLKDHLDIRCLAGCQFAVIGKGTKEALESYGILADLLPETYDSVSLGKALVRTCRRGSRILLPRALNGSRELIAILKQREDLEINEIPTYRTEFRDGNAISIKELLAKKDLNVVIFTSASTVQGFVRAAGKEPLDSFLAVCIGKQTQEAAEGYGMHATCAKEAAVDSIVECVLSFQKKTVHDM